MLSRESDRNAWKNADTRLSSETWNAVIEWITRMIDRESEPTKCKPLLQQVVSSFPCCKMCLKITWRNQIQPSFHQLDCWSHAWIFDLHIFVFVPRQWGFDAVHWLVLYAKAKYKLSLRLVPLKLSSLLPSMLQKLPSTRDSSSRNLDSHKKDQLKSTSTIRLNCKWSMTNKPWQSEPDIQALDSSACRIGGRKSQF